VKVYFVGASLLLQGHQPSCKIYASIYKGGVVGRKNFSHPPAFEWVKVVVKLVEHAVGAAVCQNLKVSARTW